MLFLIWSYGSRAGFELAKYAKDDLELLIGRNGS